MTLQADYNSLKEDDKISLGLYYARVLIKKNARFRPNYKDIIADNIKKVENFFNEYAENREKIIEFLAYVTTNQEYKKQSRALLIANLSKEYSHLTNQMFEFISKYNLYDASYMVILRHNAKVKVARTILYGKAQNHMSIMSLLIKKRNFYIKKGEQDQADKCMSQIEYLLLCNDKRQDTKNLEVTKEEFLNLTYNLVEKLLLSIDNKLSVYKERYREQNLPSFNDYVKIREEDTLKEEENNYIQITQAVENHDTSNIKSLNYYIAEMINSEDTVNLKKRKNIAFDDSTEKNKPSPIFQDRIEQDNIFSLITRKDQEIEELRNKADQYRKMIFLQKYHLYNLQDEVQLRTQETGKLDVEINLKHQYIKQIENRINQCKKTIVFEKQQINILINMVQLETQEVNELYVEIDFRDQHVKQLEVNELYVEIDFRDQHIKQLENIINQHEETMVLQKQRINYLVHTVELTTQDVNKLCAEIDVQNQLNKQYVKQLDLMLQRLFILENNGRIFNNVPNLAEQEDRKKYTIFESQDYITEILDSFAMSNNLNNVPNFSESMNNEYSKQWSDKVDVAYSGSYCSRF